MNQKEINRSRNIRHRRGKHWHWRGNVNGRSSKVEKRTGKHRIRTSVRSSISQGDAEKLEQKGIPDFAKKTTIKVDTDYLIPHMRFVKEYRNDYILFWIFHFFLCHKRERKNRTTTLSRLSKEIGWKIGREIWKKRKHICWFNSWERFEKSEPNTVIRNIWSKFHQQKKKNREREKKNREREKKR